MLRYYTFVSVVVAFFLYRFLTLTSTPAKAGTEFPFMLNESYDYIVVGSGSAGSTVAGRLSEDSDVTVLLLEAGGDDREHDHIRSQSENAKAVMDKGITRSFYTQPQDNLFQGLDKKRSHWPRGVVLGGTSSINGMMNVRGSRHDYDRWAKYTNDTSWDYRHVLPYFIKAEGMTDNSLRNSPYHGTEGPQKISQMGKHYQSNIADTIVKAFQELGYPYNEDYNGKTMKGIAYAQANIYQDQRMSAAMSYIHPVLHRRNLHVSVNSFVRKVVFDDKKRAVGVEVIKDNRKVFVKARKEIILSAGALQTPQILMLSGVGPKEHLEKLEIPVVADLPVGQNLQDHLLVLVSVTFDSPLKPPEGKHSQENLFFTSTTEETKKIDWPDLEIIFIASADRDVLRYFWNFDSNLVDEILPYRQRTPYEFACAPALLRPLSVGNLTLSSTDAFDDPVLYSNYLDKQEDMEVILKGIKICKDAVSTETMKQAGARVADPHISLCRQHPEDSHSYWECYTRAFVGTIFHYAGTSRMGEEKDPNAVVDSKLRVKKVKGLRVVDSSIMPFITSANTHAPIVMIAEKAADMIKGREPLPPLDL